MRPKKVYFPADFVGIGKCSLTPLFKDDAEYISKKFLLNYLIRERLCIRHRLESKDWKADWGELPGYEKELRDYEKTLTEFIYLLRKL